MVLHAEPQLAEHWYLTQQHPHTSNCVCVCNHIVYDVMLETYLTKTAEHITKTQSKVMMALLQSPRSEDIGAIVWRQGVVSANLRVTHRLLPGISAASLPKCVSSRMSCQTVLHFNHLVASAALYSHLTQP